jgi:hypothetical protein
MADDKKTPATLSLDAAKRMGEATEFYEQNYREEPLPKARGPRAVDDILRAAKSTTTITAASGDTPGTGTIEYYSVPETGAASGTSHTCSDSTTITLSVASGRLCFACGTCLAIPTSLSLTWLSHTGGAWSGPDDTLAYDSVTHRWVGSTIVTDSSGNTFVQYVSFSGCSFDLCITPAGSNPIPTSRCGGSSAAVSSCDPFHSATGTISGMGTSGTWTLAG